MASETISLARLRADFPALARVHEGQPVAYFDGPGGTQVPACVPAAMTDYLLHHNANNHWAFPSSQETDAIVLAAREAFADFLNCSREEVVFGANMTTLVFHLARAIGRGLAAGDEIVITELDHHANQAPWQAIAQERGLILKAVRLDTATGELDWAHFESLVGPRTRLVAVGAASNALGTVTDVARATALARRVGALSFVDAVAYAPHELVDVQALGCDFLACSAYKFHGPHVGILFGRTALLAALDVPKLEPAPDHAPDRLETGTANFEGIAGAAAAVDYLASLGEGSTRRARLASAYAGFRAHGDRLFLHLWKGLQTIPGVQVFGPPPGRPRVPTLSLLLPGMSSTEIASRLAAQGLFLSNGDFYAATVARRYAAPADGFLRVGLACYTTETEVDRLLTALRALAH